MDKVIKIAAAIIIVSALAACGDGAIQRAMTIAGVYEIKHPGGYPVVCFSDASHGGLFCMTDKQLREGN